MNDRFRTIGRKTHGVIRCAGIPALLILLGVGCNGPRTTSAVSATPTDSPVVPAKIPPIDVFKTEYPDGKVQRKTEGYKNADGKIIAHGVMRTYYQTGEKQSEVTFVAGVRHGPRIAWYRNGQVRSTGQFVNGREDGTWTVWYPNGAKAEERHYDHGTYDGTFIAWYMDGKKKSEGHWSKGKREGVHVVWDEAGNVAQRIEYVDDVAQP